MIPYDKAPFWPWIMLNHPKRDEDGYKQIRNWLADMADSSLTGPGTYVMHVVRETVGEQKVTDEHYQRLRAYNERAGALIDSEKWIDLTICVIAAHCEGAKIIEEIQSG